MSIFTCSMIFQGVMCETLKGNTILRPSDSVKCLLDPADAVLSWLRRDRAPRSSKLEAASCSAAQSAHVNFLPQ